MEERFLHLEESLHHVYPQANTVHEATSRRKHYARPELTAARGNKVQKLKHHSKGEKHISPPQIPMGMKKVTLCPQIMANISQPRCILSIPYVPNLRKKNS